MFQSLLSCVGLLLLALPTLLSAEDSPPAQEQLRAAVARSLPLLTRGAVGHREQRTCFACHSQGLPIFALTTARTRGFEIDAAELDTQLQFIAAFLGTARDRYRQGKGQGGQADTAGHALLALQQGAWQADETTAAVTEYLLKYQSDSDHWRPNSKRPPSEASPFTTTFVALRALANFGTAEQQERIAARTQTVRAWLMKTPAVDHEDRVFRLFALHAAQAPRAEIDDAVAELLATQQPDGGWSQLAGPQVSTSAEFAQRYAPLAADYTASDAYATGSALVALQQAGGVSIAAPEYQRGLQFLLRTQQDDGSWLVTSRSKPFQAYFETGFPHGKNQFISTAASAWATIALTLACTPTETSPPANQPTTLP